MKISLREKAAYGCGDFASSMFWKLFSMYLLFFYTDVFGIPAAAVGTMFLVTRIWDAINDPLMGIISDRTDSRWGKFRPYLLYGAVPFGIIGVLTFTTPDFSTSGKLVYAYITYTLMMMMYTAVNVPYSSLMGVMTNNLGDRTTLASFRFVGAFSGGILITSTANYLVDYFGGDGSGIVNYERGFQQAIMVFATVAAIFFILTFAGTRERLKPPKEKKHSLKEDLKDIARNGPWFIMLGAGISILIFNSLRDGTIMYYFKYFVKDQSVSLFGNTYSYSYTVLSSAYMTIWLATNIVGVVLAKPISAVIGKKNTFLLSVATSAIFSFILYFLQPGQIIGIFVLNIFIGISAGIVLPLIWSMYADIADYSEWKNGRRATGLIFSSSSMSQKFGWTLGGAITGWFLALFGFEANVDQTEVALLGIRLMISVIAGIGALMGAIFILLYRLDEKFMSKVEVDLKEMRGEE